jgi:D-alanine-D-alanine ligase
MLCKDKALAKQLLVFHRIRVARFVVSSWQRPLRRLGRFTYPAFVKPVGEESSEGIAKASLVRSETEALERVRFIHVRFETDAMIEEYVDGRELYLGILGKGRLTAFPPREIFFGDPPDGTSPASAAPSKPDDGTPRFATAKAKWDDAYRKKWGIRNGPAAPLPDAMDRKLGELAKRVYRILHIRGLGRIDVRLTPENEIVIIEANPNPSLAREDDFAQAAAQIGLDYDTLIQRILENALR